MTADLAIVPTHPETVAQRVRRLQNEAQDLARDHIQLLIQQIGEVEQTAHEIAQGGDAYPAGVRDLARRLVEDCDARAAVLQGVMARAGR